MESVPISLAQVILSGRLRLFRTLEDGREFVVGFLGPGGHLGFSVVYREVHDANAEAIEPTVVCSIDKDTYLRIVRKFTGIALAVILELGREIEESRRRLMDLALKSGRERVASHLLSLVDVPSPACRSELVSLESSRQDVSRMIGLSTETVFRILTDFHKEGLIRLHRRSRRIDILDFRKLERLSGENA